MNMQNPHTTQHQGKIALISGGTSATGLATARRLLGESGTA
jgi:NAD(P)-dependent dehydrogenase (short-subunit alcohol dehydrogenase family)